MTVIRSGDPSTLPKPRTSAVPRRPSKNVHVEALPRLEWSLVVEEPPVAEAAAPSSLRHGWIHKAPQEQVLHLFRKLSASNRPLPAPWWLGPLDRGELPSRSAGFAVEDDLHQMLTTRDGWVFVPWASAGESGYWEFSPSDRYPMSVPTTVSMTAEHRGWVDVVPAYSETAPTPIRMSSLAEIAERLPAIESW